MNSDGINDVLCWIHELKPIIHKVLLSTVTKLMGVLIIKLLVKAFIKFWGELHKI